MRLFYLALIALVATACTRVGTAPPGARHAWTVPHVLRIADVGEPDHFNPLLSGMDLVYDLDSLVFSFLIMADDHGKLVGDLATAVPSIANKGISADGRTYIYQLRHGVRWHDGVPFTSKDVKFSWEASMNPHNNTLHRECCDQVASIDTPDKYTVVVHLKRRYPPFETKFFTPLQEGVKGIIPAHLLGRLHDINNAPFNAHPIGTGPFKFVSWDRGREIVLARNDDYFRGRPKIEKIVFSVVPDDNAILNLVKTHEIDLVTSPPVQLYPQYKALADVSVTLAPWNAINQIPLNEKHPGLNDVAVRRALSMAIDYDAVTQKIEHGVGIIAHDLLPVQSLGYTDLPPYRYDPAAANALLESHGYKLGADGVRAKGKVRLDYVIDITAASANQKAIAAFLQPELKAIGVNLSIKMFPYQTIYAYNGPVYGGAYDLTDISETLPYDPDHLFDLGCNEWFPKGENLWYYCNSAVDAQFKRGLSSDDPAVRAPIYHRIEQTLHDEVPQIPLYVVQRLVVRNPDIKNFSTAPASAPWWNAWQWDI